MLTVHLALVSQTTRISHDELLAVAGALQRQLTRDFGPHWGIDGTVQPFAQLRDVPTGYWPIVVRDDLQRPGVIGLHLDDHGQPTALVQHTNVWSLAASHEMLEMLADPYGNRLVQGGSLMRGQGVVEHLLEVADPVNTTEAAYVVNGVLVSDFVTPAFWSHPAPVPGATYSFTGAATRPRDPILGGYMAWFEPIRGQWWQAYRGPNGLEFSRLGRTSGAALGLRRSIDDDHAPAELRLGVSPDHPKLAMAAGQRESFMQAGAARAVVWQRQIDALVGPSDARRSRGPGGETGRRFGGMKAHLPKPAGPGSGVA
ncbi:MAG: hypothetical protein U0Y82_00595 [Thermoleophilia bacterium]